MVEDDEIGREIEPTNSALALRIIGLGYLMSTLIFKIGCPEKIWGWSLLSSQEKRTETDFHRQQ